MHIDPKDFWYNLPDELIANQPAEPRDSSKLMVVNRGDYSLQDLYFRDIRNFLTSDDVLVLNDTKVIPARLLGAKETGGKVTILLLKQLGPITYQVICSPGVKVGTSLNFKQIKARVIGTDEAAGEIIIEFQCEPADLYSLIDRFGKMPVPPYIQTSLSEEEIRQRYQTIFAKESGSAAAPTAGLHFTQELLSNLKDAGVQIEYVTLHVGPGTFQKLRKENLETRTLHQEFYEIKPEVAQRLLEAKNAGKRIVAVGTTSTRTLESAYFEDEKIFKIGWHPTQLFIYPPYEFKFVDALITNFHLPKSSLLMLVTAFMSAPQSKSEFTSFEESLAAKAYRHAVESKYRFFSFGDAMFIV